MEKFELKFGEFRIVRNIALQPGRVVAVTPEFEAYVARRMSQALVEAEARHAKAEMVGSSTFPNPKGLYRDDVN